MLFQVDGLLISHAGFVAQRRLARGVRLNHGEATVTIDLIDSESRQ
jgi:urease gamma subunit